ncbi:uncharacterized protein AB675_10974 [Cyphellophora attinorum]|uniref:Uncharacterized protein n=1 Tax=Cyphellophora attinorum TaxID=1664694 RepID=A0A0N0NIA9_9EURO|nr:uncharacterized protein AB675_10974 [Phialophora attinorum]KPI35528.1 hypothetical protein AB675_10974 [Phialophora attinorum]
MAQVIYPRLVVVHDVSVDRGTTLKCRVEISPTRIEGPFTFTFKEYYALPECLTTVPVMTPNPLSAHDRVEIHRLVNKYFRLLELANKLSDPKLPWLLGMACREQFVRAILLEVGCFDFMRNCDPLPTTCLELSYHIYQSACEAVVAMLPAFKIHGFVIQHPELDTIIIEYFGYTVPQCLISMLSSQGQDLRHHWLKYSPWPDDETKVLESPYLQNSRWILVKSPNRFLTWGIRLAETVEEAKEVARYCARNQIETYIVDLDGMHTGSHTPASGLDAPVPAPTMTDAQGRDRTPSADRALPSIETDEP